MSARLAGLVAILLVVATLEAACGSSPDREASPLSATTTPRAPITSTTGAGSPQEASTGVSYPWSGNYGTILDPSDTSVTEPIAGLDEYATSMRALKDEYTPKFAIDSNADDFTDFLHSVVKDPMNATQSEIDAWKRFGELAHEYASGLKGIKPPRQLAEAHAVLVKGWEMIAHYCDLSLQAIKNKDSSAIAQAEEIRSEEEILLFSSDDSWAVGNAIGFWPHPWGE